MGNRVLSILWFMLLANIYCTRLFAQHADSITIAIAPEYDDVSKFHRVLFGEAYRKLWATPVKVRIIQLRNEKGGLTVVEKGGGLQTKSLKLKDSNDRLWVLRSIQKYPERALPSKLKATIAKDILQDQVATGHPFAALTVPPFAEALGIPHSNPEIVYVADDPELGEFRDDFANSVLLLEERDPLTSVDTDNSEKVLEKSEKNHNNRIDQKLVLRARLLDLILGDWDRHEGQWRWDEQKQDDETLYLPYPRDRDKVYYNTSGVFPWLLSRQGLKSNLQGFHQDIRDIAGYNFNNRYFDRIFLTQLSEQDWKKEITYVENTLTDDLITKAVQRMPYPIYKLTGEHIIRTLIVRRGILKKQALKYYRSLAIRVDVAASDKRELFNITTNEQGNVLVEIFKIDRAGEANKIIYRRLFERKHTKDVRLYGLAGNDIFSVKGASKSAIRIRMIGGDGVDSFFVDKNLNTKSKVHIYDRSDEVNILPSQSLARIRVSDDSMVNNYDKHQFRYDKRGPIFSLFYTMDQGVLLKAGMNYEKHNFRKEPFAEKHSVIGNYASRTNSFMFQYAAYLTKVLKKNDLKFDFLALGPNNANNFFGIGNETQFINDANKPLQYYQNRYDFVSGDVRLVRSVSKNVTLTAGLATQFYTSSEAGNSGRFFKAYNESRPVDKVFSDRFYTGIVAGSSIDTRNNGLFSTHGFLWGTEVAGMNELTGERKPFARVTSELNYYIPILKDSNIVIANRLGGGTTIGNPAFFQKMQLGGIKNLRGFNVSRFTGKTMFYHNLDIRSKIFDFNSYLFPGTVGVVGFNDVGRVWEPEEKSNLWHHGYGVGIYVIPADIVLIQALVAKSVEGVMPYISIGFSF